MMAKAYIHEYGNGKLEPEHADVKTVLEERGIECELFTTKRLSRNQLVLNETTLVVGDHPTLETVFKRIGHENFRDSYPMSLRPHLKRRIWESTIGQLRMQSYTQELSPIFVKPKHRAKLFSGFVLQSNEELFRLDHISKNTKVYCSGVVEWLAEYRVFVHKSEIVGVRCYEGDSEFQLNMSEVKQAVQDFERSGDRTDAYGIDFGVLKSGETAIIEWNDGFALGAYGLDKEIYTDLILSRWEEIVKSTF